MTVTDTNPSVAIISDTHLPRGQRQLPDACLERLSAADLIIHAGDFSSIDVLDQLEGLRPTVAVHGNVDDMDIRSRLPYRLNYEVGPVSLGIVHDAGPAKGRLRRLQEDFPNADAVVFGHSHIPLLEQDPDTGFQIFNPGSPTDRRRQPHHTMGWAQVDDAGRLSFELIPLD